MAENRQYDHEYKVQAVKLAKEIGQANAAEEPGISHHPGHKPNGITEADRVVRKSDDLLKRDFSAGEPLTKYVTDITEIKARNGKLYVSAIFDCFDSSMIGLAIDTNMKSPLCVQTLENAVKADPDIREAIIHSVLNFYVQNPAAGA